jgi:hypothetical protein
MLFRLIPGRDITTDLAHAGGSSYTATIDVPDVENVKANGVIKNHSYNKSTNLLTVTLASAPDADTNVIIVFYNLFFTGEKYRYLPKDPTAAESSFNEVNEWLPLIESYPQLTENTKNAVVGTITSSNTTIVLDNSEDHLSKYTGPKDTFYNKSISIWMVINSVDNIELMFKGFIVSYSSDELKITLKTSDAFSALDSDAFVGDLEVEAKAIRGSTDFPNVDPNRHKDPIPLYFGETTPHMLSDATFDNGTYAITYKRFLDGPNSIIANYDAGDDPNNLHNGNRIIGRSHDNQTKAVGTYSGFVRSNYLPDNEAAPVYATHVVIQYTSHTLRIGEPVYWSVAGMGDVTGVVVWNQSFTFSRDSLTYNIIIELYYQYPKAAFTSPEPEDGGGTPDGIISVKRGPILFVLQGDETLLLTGDNATGGPSLSQVFRMPTTEGVGTFQTENDHYIYQALLFNDFESWYFRDDGVWGSTGYQRFGDAKIRTTAQIKYFYYQQTVHTHADCLEHLLTDALPGITVDTASFNAADAALSANSLFSIPFWKKTDYESLRHYVEALLKSTLGYLVISDTGKVEYHIFDSLSSSKIIDATSFLESSFAVRVDYRDIATTISGFNLHAQNSDNIDASNTAFAEATNNGARYLHEIENTLVYNHVLDRIDNRIDDILDILSKRRAVYSISVPVESIDKKPGDDITLVNDKVLGTDNSIVIRLTNTIKTTQSAKLSGEDLGG